MSSAHVHTRRKQNTHHNRHGSYTQNIYSTERARRDTESISLHREYVSTKAKLHHNSRHAYHTNKIRTETCLLTWNLSFYRLLSIARGGDTGYNIQQTEVCQQRTFIFCLFLLSCFFAHDHGAWSAYESPKKLSIFYYYYNNNIIIILIIIPG